MVSKNLRRSATGTARERRTSSSMYSGTPSTIGITGLLWKRMSANFTIISRSSIKLSKYRFLFTNSTDLKSETLPSYSFLLFCKLFIQKLPVRRFLCACARLNLTDAFAPLVCLSVFPACAWCACSRPFPFTFSSPAAPAGWASSDSSRSEKSIIFLK